MTERKTTTPPVISRRAVLGAAAAIPVFGATSGRAKSLFTDQVSARQDDTYDTVALAKDSVDYACVQHAVLPVDATDPQPGINRNLKRMVTLIDEHAHWAGPADLLSFPAFPVAGFAGSTREEVLAVTIDVPGKETDVLAAKAREYSMWLTFGCYARNPDWPGHVLSLGVLMNPNGEIVAEHWTTQSRHWGNPASEFIITSVYDVLPRYVEMYGWDKVIPVARTPVGNISLIGAQHDPLLFSAMAVKGCELCIRQATGSNLPSDDASLTSRYDPYFTSVLSHSGNRNVRASAMDSNETQIIGPNGQQLAKALGRHEEIVRDSLPLAVYRKTRHAPRTMQHAAARFYGGGYQS